MRAPAPTSDELQGQLAAAQLAIHKASGTAPNPLAPTPATAGSLCATSPPAGTQISALGDSVMLAATQGLLTALPGIDIDADTSRSMQIAPDILAPRIRNGSLRPVVLLGLGTNGEFSREMLDGLLDQIGPTRKVYLVNVFLQSQPWTAEVNQTLAAVAKARPNVHLADWQVTAGTHADLLYADGIHPQPGAGADLYARMVVSTMTGHKPCPRIAHAPPLPPRPSARANTTRADSSAPAGGLSRRWRASRPSACRWRWFWLCSC